MVPCETIVQTCRGTDFICSPVPTALPSVLRPLHLLIPGCILEAAFSSRNPGDEIYKHPSLEWRLPCLQNSESTALSLRTLETASHHFLASVAADEKSADGLLALPGTNLHFSLFWLKVRSCLFFRMKLESLCIDAAGMSSQLEPQGSSMLQHFSSKSPQDRECLSLPRRQWSGVHGRDTTLGTWQLPHCLFWELLDVCWTSLISVSTSLLAPDVPFLVLLHE